MFRTCLAVLILSAAAALSAACDVVFLAVPHGVAMEMGAALYDAGARVVDLSADFRLRDAAVYEKWYGTPHSRAGYLDKAVYGLPELRAEEIGRTRLVANPGCYPTASILGLHAALKNGLVHTDDIVIDRGVRSGAQGGARLSVLRGGRLLQAL